MDISGFIVDHMGHFSLYDLPGAVFAVVMAAVLTLVLTRVAGAGSGWEARQLVLWATGAALAVAFVRGQLPVAVCLLALVILARPRSQGHGSDALFFGALAIGLGCGSGATLVTAMLVIPYMLLARWAQGGAKDPS